MTIIDMLTILSFGIAAFQLGYMLGNKKKKNNRLRLKMAVIS